MAKKKSTKTLKQEIEEDRRKLDKEVEKSGFTYSGIVGVIIVIIGLLLVLFNLAGVLIAFVGLVLIYFGLKVLGYNIHL